jgi:hypothetical protein
MDSTLVLRATSTRAVLWFQFASGVEEGTAALGEGDTVGVAEEEGVAVAVRVGVTEGEGEDVGSAVLDGLAMAESDAEGVAELEGGMRLVDGVALRLDDTLGVLLVEGLALGATNSDRTLDIWWSPVL